ncbi:ubiquitin carboxyl-terminal hydrolase 8 isoform X2 [Impatiens glandulifera]|uniref:ubiquitin carboxyl-terminal hydrolase 8 isoform X2 n=1 Tax=Impatiens glandulifera TaxID=253017 RepID=UPI001FB09FAC|nr:ubiquitin carboxyl-terminal hydrolase 8 isoform X2 [Impatiens glandulifera]
MDDLPEDSATESSHQCSVSDDVDNQRVYLVPYRWWKEAQESPSSVDLDGGVSRVLYTASQTSSYGPMKIINNIFNSDLAFNLRRENESLQNNENSEVGVSGRDYALVTGDMWVQALKWHIDSKAASKNGRSFSIAEDDITDVYPLQLKLSLSRETESLIVKISKKDNTTERFRRACKIFCVESELLRIWDFAGRTNHIFSDDKSKLGKESPRQSEQEILLELQVYGLSDFNKGRDAKKDEAEQSSTGNSLKMNGYSVNYSFPRGNGSVNSEAGSLGLTGLQNLGNTCFMNSALQCLAHTPKVVDYFLGDYNKEINHENPLGMDGEIALAFGDLLRKLWAPGATPVPPRLFKSKLARFAPQFSGFNQHDSQELLAFLLDGLHEDVNRVKCKPYVEAKDGDGRPDEEVADEYWRNHLARNDSVIVDVCQGQYRSTLVCPVCRKVSVTFDPFMYLSLPLPSTTMRTMTLTVITTDGSALPSPVTVSVLKSGKLEDLIRALGVACSLGPDEELLVAEVYNNRIIRYLEEPSDSLSLIRDDDRLVVYRLLKDVENNPAVVFMHQQAEENYNATKLTSSWKAFGIPLIACSKIVNGLDVRDLYLKLIKASMVPSEDPVGDDGIIDKTNNQLSAIEKPMDIDTVTTSCSEEGAHCANRDDSDDNLEFYLTNEKGTDRETRIAMDEPIKVTALSGRLSVLVCWPGSMVNLYKTSNLPSSIPQVFKPDFLSKRPQETVSLYKCLEAFLKEEPLGPDDMWYCPNCKEHRQASKKLDLWRLPEVLVIHLKRFSYSRFLKNKLETFVDFPVHDFDLSTYMTHRNDDQLSNRYMLYAISNHYGSMGGGHYTAFVNHGGDQWYDFDDSHVSPVGEDRIKTSAAYVLFYRRIMDS